MSNESTPRGTAKGSEIEADFTWRVGWMDADDLGAAPFVTLVFAGRDGERAYRLSLEYASELSDAVQDVVHTLDEQAVTGGSRRPDQKNERP